MSEIPRTYPSWLKGEVKSAQKEYTEPTKLLADDGTLLSPGWARHMVFDYDRTKSTPTMRRKEWDFYQISDGRYMIQISFANISIGGYASAALVDLRNPKKNKKLAAGTLTAPTALFLGGKDKYVLPPKGDVPNHVKMDGETVPIDARFSNGLRYPCDPEGPARETIKCRCYVTYNR